MSQYHGNKVFSEESYSSVHLFLYNYFASRNVHKAFGEDLIPNALVKSNPLVMADLYAPIVLCRLQNCTEPFQWAGGMMHDMPKKPGVVDVEKRSGVILEDLACKAFHSFALFENYATC